MLSLPNQLAQIHRIGNGIGKSRSKVFLCSPFVSRGNGFRKVLVFIFGWKVQTSSRESGLYMAGVYLWWYHCRTGDKVSMLTHTYPHTLLRKIKVAICSHQADDPLCVSWCLIWWYASWKSVMPYMTPNALTETRGSWTLNSLMNEWSLSFNFENVGQEKFKCI